MFLTPLRGKSSAAAGSGKLAMLATALVLAGFVSACDKNMIYSDGIALPAEPLRAPQTAFPIKVEPQTETLSLSADPVSPGGIGEANAAKVGVFASNYMRHGHGPLIIESATTQISEQTFEQIKTINGILAERGVPLARLQWRTAPAAPGGAAAEPAPDADKDAIIPLVLSYTRYLATSAPCGDWSRDFGSSHSNQPSPNFGCATQHNLAVMVSDPADLKQPRSIDPSDAVRRAEVVKKYQQGLPTSTLRGENETGTVSEVVP